MDNKQNRNNKKAASRNLKKRMHQSVFVTFMRKKLIVVFIIVMALLAFLVYRIYAIEKVYGETLEQTTDNEMTLKNDIPEEEMSYDERSKTKPKIRVLRPGYMNNRNAAFSKINFILLMIGIFTVSIAIANILIKLKK